MEDLKKRPVSMRPTRRAPKMNPPYYKQHLGGGNTSILCPTHHKKNWKKCLCKIQNNHQKRHMFWARLHFSTKQHWQNNTQYTDSRNVLKTLKKYITRKQRVLLGGGNRGVWLDLNTRYSCMIPV